MEPSSSANDTRAMCGQPRRLYTQGHFPEGNVEKSSLIRFVDELDFKEILVSVKRKKKEGCPSGLILVNFNREFKSAESSSESSSVEEDEVEGEINSDQGQTSILSIQTIRKVEKL